MAAVILLVPSPALAEGWPAYSTGLSYLLAFGRKQYPVLSLLLALIALSLAVVTVIAILVLVGMFWRRAPATSPAEVPLARTGHGIRWIYIGMAVTIPLLFGISAWTYSVLADISGVPPNAITIQVTGHQWWWAFRYVGDDPHRTFVTADEIHIPVGEPVRIELTTSDVIHSFWVPALAGKMDTIAGEKNVTWIEADQPGVYRGQCTEYCGVQHAHMAFLAVAEPPDQFKAWWDRQLEGAHPPRSEPRLSAFLQGETAFVQHCGVCHTVRGTLAGGHVGPDLSHLMLRRTIAAGTLPNTIGDLSGWISDPQHIKPGNYMPTLALSGVELDRIRAFLTGLN